jgi:hypothetical protein
MRFTLTSLLALLLASCNAGTSIGHSSGALPLSASQQMVLNVVNNSQYAVGVSELPMRYCGSYYPPLLPQGFGLQPGQQDTMSGDLDTCPDVMVQATYKDYLIDTCTVRSGSPWFAPAVTPTWVIYHRYTGLYTRCSIEQNTDGSWTFTYARVGSKERKP